MAILPFCSNSSIPATALAIGQFQFMTAQFYGAFYVGNKGSPHFFHFANF